MKTRRRLSVLGRLTVTLALLPGAAIGAPQSLSLEVTPRISTAPGGTSVVLTARLSAVAAAPVTVDFQVEGGPGQLTQARCAVDTGSDKCTTVLRGEEKGTSVVRARIDGTQPDPREPAPRPEDCPLGETLCQATFEEPGEAAEPDNGSDTTDVVQATWTTFVAGHLQCSGAHDRDGSHVSYLRPSAPQETWNCVLTTLTGAPISGVGIMGKKNPGANNAPGKADYAPLCTTGGDGGCGGTVSFGPTPDAFEVCFWADGDGNGDVYAPGGSSADGGGCRVGGNGGVRSDITDVVRVDIADPRPSVLDARPKDQVAAPGSRFTISTAVMDQFGNPYEGQAQVKAALFSGSPLHTGANAPSSPEFTCTTSTGGVCSMVSAPQGEPGRDLACVWIGPDPTMIGDNLGGGCGPDGLHQELLSDSMAEEAAGRHRVGDGIDVVRFAVQSHPVIFTVTPSEKRQDTTGDVLGVDGINFLPSAQITIAGTGISLGPTYVVSDTRLEASLDVALDAPPGARDVTVTNRADGGTTICTGCFHVVGQGYWLVASDGGIFAYGDAAFAGSAAGAHLTRPIVGIAATPSGKGYWLVASDGGIFAYGDAPFAGSAAGADLTRPIVGIAATPSGKGYWLVASDGGIFAYGDARFFGTTSRLTLTKPIVGIASTPSGRGYWVVASDGGIFAFGDARFLGGTGNLTLNRPITAMAVTRTGKGYWLIGSDGGVFAYGDATFYGSTGSLQLNQPIVAITTTPSGKGYWLVASDGGVFSFGDAGFLGSTGAVKLNQPIVGFTRR